MWQLISVVYTIASTVLAGSIMIAALVLGRHDIYEVLPLTLIGLVAAIPISYIVGKRLYHMGEEEA